jgi:hypothetical protein
MPEETGPLTPDAEFPGRLACLRFALIQEKTLFSLPNTSIGDWKIDD